MFGKRISEYLGFQKVWLGLYLREPRLKALIPLRRP